MLIGHLHRNNRPGTSTLLKKFKKLDDDCDGFIDKIRNPACIDGSGADVEVPFIEVPVSKSGAVTTSDDETGLCAMFQHIKENNNANEFRGHFECIDQAKYEQIQSQENDFGEVAFDNEDEPGDELSKNKRKASDIPEKRLRFVDSTLTASNAKKDAQILELTTAVANLETKSAEIDRLRRLVEKTKEELAARDAEILELRKPSTAGPPSAKDQHPGLLQFKAGAGKYDAAMKQVRDLEAKLKTATDEMNRLYGEVNRLEQELERAAPAPSSAGGGGPGWADQFVLSNAKWVVVVSLVFSSSHH
jgi:HAMP domain-containing protein